MIKYLQLYCLLLLPMWNIAQTNIIPNGNFEQYDSNQDSYAVFSSWSIGTGLKSDEAHNGNYSLRLFPNGSRAYLYVGGEKNVLDVKEGAEYTFTYWYKGTLSSPQPDINLIFAWYTDSSSTRVLRYETRKEELTPSASWQKREFKIEIPTGVSRAGITFQIGIGTAGYIDFDDISMVFSKSGNNSGVVPVPSNVKTTSFQREILVEWGREGDHTLLWEVVVNDATPQITYTNSFLVTELEPNTSYKLKVRAKKGDKFSGYTSEIQALTQQMNYSVEDVQRIPHLRTLGEYGTPSRTIDLFYNDLANKNAKINYYIDGQSITPTQNKLTFPKIGKQKLRISIEETPERKWNLEYILNVQN